MSLAAAVAGPSSVDLCFDATTASWDAYTGIASVRKRTEPGSVTHAARSKKLQCRAALNFDVLCGG